MSRILQINSSILGDNSKSTLLANELVAKLAASDAGSSVTVRDLGANPLPAHSGAAIGALFTPAEQRNAEQQAVVSAFDSAIEELQAADVVVIGVPMYNFNVPTQLKEYFDAVARARVTFRYTESGVEGLLKGKKVYVVHTRGGLHAGQPSDTITPYLNTFLAFLGMTDVEHVFAEGLAIGPEQAEAGLKAARQEIERLAA